MLEILGWELGTGKLVTVAYANNWTEAHIIREQEKNNYRNTYIVRRRS
jgi:hypothetical protein